MRQRTHKNIAATNDSSPDGAGRARRRVATACSRCRVKKSKCDGKTPCGNCQHHQGVCSYTLSPPAARRPYSQKHARYLVLQHERMVIALADMYKRLVAAGGWEGSSLEETSEGTFSVNEILLRLGHIDNNEEALSDPCTPDDDSVQSEIGTDDLEARPWNGSKVEQQFDPQKGTPVTQASSIRYSSEPQISMPTLNIVSDYLNEARLNQGWTWFPQEYAQLEGGTEINSPWSCCTQLAASFRNEPTCTIDEIYHDNTEAHGPSSHYWK